MSYESTDIYLFDRTPQANPVAGVVVKVMNQTGTLIYGLGTTDTNGKASFLLPSELTYQLRFFKQAVSFNNPQLITVLTTPIAPQSNIFEVLCEPFVVPVSMDSRLCVASGFFRGPDGSPADNIDIHFIPKFSPILLEGSGLLVERVSIRTDKRGYAQVTLIRFAQYDVTIQGFEDTTRPISVADQSAVNMPDLIFPVVQQITFDPPVPTTLAPGEEVFVTPTVITSDMRILEGTATGDVNWSTNDSNTLAVAPGPTQISLRGVDPGVAIFNGVRNDSTIIRIPNTPILGLPVEITVQ